MLLVIEVWKRARCWLGIGRSHNANLTPARVCKTRLCALALELNPVLRLLLILCVFFVGIVVVLVHEPASIEVPKQISWRRALGGGFHCCHAALRSADFICSGDRCRHYQVNDLGRRLRPLGPGAREEESRHDAGKFASGRRSALATHVCSLPLCIA